MTEYINIAPTQKGIARMKEAIEQSIARIEEDLDIIDSMVHSGRTNREEVLFDKAIEMLQTELESSLEGLKEALSELEPNSLKTGKERLAFLSKFLRNKPFEAGTFDMSTFGRYREEDKKADPFECGFAACAGGWACSIPEFKNLGLRIEPTMLDSNVYNIGFEGKWGMNALMRFFDMDYQDCLRIFGILQYGSTDIIDPVRVADRIDLFLETGSVPR